MDKMKGIPVTDDTFSSIKSVVSSWYDDNNCISMLKVVYKDHLTNNALRATKTVDILNALYASGDLSRTDLYLLYDTINITEQDGVKDKIKAVYPSFPNVKEIDISRFSDHRQKIVKFGHALVDDDIQKIDGEFNNPTKKYADRWVMITDLEHKMKIGKGKLMKTFIKTLKRLGLVHAVSTLVEDITPSSTGKRTHETRTMQNNPKKQKGGKDITPSSTGKRTHETTTMQNNPKKKKGGKDITPSSTGKRTHETRTMQNNPKKKKGEKDITPRSTRKRTHETTTMQNNPKKKRGKNELSEIDFQQLLKDVSSWWKKHGNVNMLKVLLSEFEEINEVEIDEQNHPAELFKLLVANGDISATDPGILIEAAVLGGLRGVEPKIKKMIPTFSGFSEVVIRRFSNHRKNLMKFGKAMSKCNKDIIRNLWNLDVDRGTDQWGVIFELERKKILTLDTKQSFIRRLEQNDMIREADALKTF